MQTLIPFKPIESKIVVRAEVQRTDSRLTLCYEVVDQNSALELPLAFRALGSAIERADGLWNDTCFEMFIRPEGADAYYELNFSLRPAWNVYHFEAYRHPQPPKITQDFTMKSMQWNGQQLKIELDNLLTAKSMTISLTAVIKEKSGMKHYLALSHQAAQPDFHLNNSFILKK
ncbi:MAG: hypothetical protein H7061_11830 [Bdellovibrionaceae bacterium]|nr:hypothetical protein [Bdellovibrio sp.]